MFSVISICLFFLVSLDRLILLKFPEEIILDELKNHSLPLFPCCLQRKQSLRNASPSPKIQALDSFHIPVTDNLIIDSLLCWHEHGHFEEHGLKIYCLCLYLLYTGYNGSMWKAREDTKLLFWKVLTEDSLLWNNTKKLPPEEPQQKEWNEEQAAAQSQPQTHCHCPSGNIYQ